MKLVKAEIFNFRSIKDMTISFDPKCLVLVGINESGKSNILQALSLLSPNPKFEDFDVRQVHPEEDYPNDSHVKFYFEFEEEELDELIENFSSKIVGGIDDKKIIDGVEHISW
ncbi:MAG: AAA family ATPase, partial [Nanoarchaeota archaeon]|nr:AAA family ATPase [Nanoarchaeota archaeon]